MHRNECNSGTDVHRFMLPLTGDAACGVPALTSTLCGGVLTFTSFSGDCRSNWWPHGRMRKQHTRSWKQRRVLFPPCMSPLTPLLASATLTLLSIRSWERSAIR